MVEERCEVIEVITIRPKSLEEEFGSKIMKISGRTRNRITKC
jgi:hypothetical protein